MPQGKAQAGWRDLSDKERPKRIQQSTGLMRSRARKRPLVEGTHPSLAPVHRGRSSSGQQELA
ncbi:hypothetical protein GCM10023335_36700 [Streptomyces siamensis]|uniref:Uncharacterized protein n=1 Tax=Streptomyces siamensis TaxID=1274986 RepID=A0ABP9IZQ7_9ACTN